MTFFYLSNSCVLGRVTIQTTLKSNAQTYMQKEHKDIYHLLHYVLILLADYLLWLDLFRRN